ncbi:MAG TPA: hypothetical protein VF595_17340 [Tepidisphaeraceae bacterium]
MMSQIGQILSQSVPLTDHDLEEILQEQKTTRQRFGDAALSLGKARPEQVWEAWLTQLQEGPVDLTRVPPEDAAVAIVPAGLATFYNVVPLRVRGCELVVAAVSLSDSAVVHLARRTGMRVIVAHAKGEDIDRVLAQLYPTTPAADVS